MNIAADVVWQTSNYEHCANLTCHILLFHMCLAPTCPAEIPLVNGPVPIPYSHMTASSQYDTVYYGAHGARFHYTTAWCPTGHEV